MACVVKGEKRGRPGKWLVDLRDATGRRRILTFNSKGEAEDALHDLAREARQPSRPAVDTNITVKDYSERWLDMIAANVKPRTRESYKDTLRLHILPLFGDQKLRLLHKGQIKTFLANKLKSNLSRNSVRIIHATMRAMLNAAVDDGIILANPADKLGRSLRLVMPNAARQENIKAMNRNQVYSFLTAAARDDTRHYPLFLLLARTGTRIGEALALQWDDIDFAAREIRVARSISGGRTETPKSAHGRTVDMSEQLSKTLRRLHLDRQQEKLRRGWREMPSWVFISDAGKPLDDSRVRKEFTRCLKAARLPLHFSPHCLRHTFASLLLQAGHSPAYVQRQLGHASIQLTVDTYGRWLPLGNKAAVDGLDEPSGIKTVAETESGAPGAPETPDSFGGPSRTRTLDPLIKSQLLYQLS